MQKRDKAALISCIIFGFLLLGTVIFSVVKGSVYTLQLPSHEDIRSAVLEENGAKTTIEEPVEMSRLLKALRGSKGKRWTFDWANRAEKDTPEASGGQIIRIIFNLQNGSAKVYVCAKDGKYFIFQPYNGRFRITEDEFNEIKGFMK